MIKTFTLGDATIAYCPIVRGGGKPREAEREVVSALLAHLLPGAHLSHLPSGAPVVDARRCISVSHSRRIAVLAAADAPIGVDAEENREAQLRRVAPRVLTEQEMAACPDLLLAWTAKEAAFKAVPGLASLLDVTLLSEREAEAGGKRLTIESVMVEGTRVTLARVNKG